MNASAEAPYVTAKEEVSESQRSNHRRSPSQYIELANLLCMMAAISPQDTKLRAERRTIVKQAPCEQEPFNWSPGFWTDKYRYNMTLDSALRA